MIFCSKRKIFNKVHILIIEEGEYLKSLKDYIREQADNNVDPQIVRNNLVRSGWKPEQVDQVILDIYAKRDSHVVRGNKHLLRAMIIVIAIVLVVMLSIYQFVINKVPTHDPELGTSMPPNLNGGLTNSQSSDCDSISSSVEKDNCYYEKVKSGFDCETLTDRIERNFCFRALDVYIMAY